MYIICYVWKTRILNVRLQFGDSNFDHSQEKWTFLEVSQSGFWPRRIHTASIVTNTRGGGLENDLISVISLLFSELSASSAAFNAGKAASRSFCASSLISCVAAACCWTCDSSLPTVSFTCLIGDVDLIYLFVILTIQHKLLRDCDEPVIWLVSDTTTYSTKSIQQYWIILRFSKTNLW